MHIRSEEIRDYKEVFKLIENAFENEVYTDHKEQFLVERLRNSKAFIPELSLVAEIDGEITGYILLTKIKIINNDIQKTSLALAPVAVLKKIKEKELEED
ncbi:GNAT family N-acetyltransferase [Haoranjiania flava]|uniref:N-acetyltransferase n=1 Tax=Haoranjiania flava TaxID=1856322 RepID=A0AAE3IRW2_9BACT|nr:N-acetyltransferase [Haoranjiania flava]MCU7695266.1 N-acetyltransferase [Haoranjiania flava]